MSAPAKSRSLVFGVALVAAVSLAVVSVQAHAAPEAPPAGSDPMNTAAQLFDAGKGYYDRGEYGRAIDTFREVYRLAPDPLVLFAIAQAQRLGGDCAGALGTYRRFLADSTDESLRRQSEAHVATLSVHCPSAAVARSEAQPAGPGPVVAPVKAAPAPVGDERGERRRIALYGGIGGVVVSALGGGVYLWNTSRVDDWRKEDAWLVGPHAARQDPEEFWQRQEANDALSRSVSRYDRVALAFVITGGAVILGSVLMYLLDEGAGGGRP